MGNTLLNVTSTFPLSLSHYLKRKKRRKKKEKLCIISFNCLHFPLPPFPLLQPFQSSPLNFHKTNPVKSQRSTTWIIWYSVLTHCHTWSDLTQLITFSLKCLLHLASNKLFFPGFPLISCLHKSISFSVLLSLSS